MKACSHIHESTRILGLSTLPPYNFGAVGQFPNRTHDAQREREAFDTMAVEVATTATRKRYRLVDRSGETNRRDENPLMSAPATASVKRGGHNDQITLLIASSATMTTTSGSSSIFKDGKLKPGIYKIQNLKPEYYLDVRTHSMEVCCRAERDLEEGRGLVRVQPSSVRFVCSRLEVGSHTPWRWICDKNGEIAYGSSIDRLPLFVKEAEFRLNQGNRTSSVTRGRVPALGPHFSSLPILRPGESRKSRAGYIKDLAMSGQGWTMLNPTEWLTEAADRIYWGPTKKTWDQPGNQSGGGVGRDLQISTFT